MMQAWGVVSQTALAPVFLQNMMRLMFPDEGESYAEMLQTGNEKDQLLQQLMQIINSLIIDPQTGQLNEEAQDFAPQIKMLQAKVTDILGQSNGKPGNPELTCRLVAKLIELDDIITLTHNADSITEHGCRGFAN